MLAAAPQWALLVLFLAGRLSTLVCTAPDAQPEDEGIYNVTANNEHESSSKVHKVHISEMEKPILATGEHEVVSIVGERIELTCTVLKGNPFPNTTWYKDGEKLEKEDLTTLGGNVLTDGSIVFENVKLECEGIYECEVKNIFGETRKRINLKVHAIPNCADERNLVIVRKGSDAELPCNMYGVPIPTVLWLKDSNRLDTSSYRHNSGNLFIPKSTTVDNGTYECILQNEAGHAKKQVELLVHFSPHISSRNDEKVIKRGEKTDLRCIVNAFPPAKILWFKDRHPFNDASITYTENSSNFSLTGSASSDGVYTCVAQNEEGRDSIDIYVKVQEKPKFKQNEVHILFYKGENVTLSCDNDGLPTPTHTWYALRYKEHSSQILDRNNRVITFTNVHESFAGIYWCKANNSAGIGYKYFIVSYVKAPKIITFISAYILRPGSDFEMSCNAAGKPEPVIYWLKNGEPIISHKKKNVLRISNASLKDVATYSCVAGNYEGSDQQNLEIKLAEPPHIDEMHTLIPLRKVKESENITISCPPIGGNPQPSIRWYNVTGKTFLEKSKKIRLKNRNRTLKLQEIKLWHSGIYQCQAYNEFGNTYADTRILVLKEPTFLNEEITNRKEDKRIRIGEELKLNCSNNGSPKPKVLWYKNGAILEPSLLSHAKPTDEDIILIPKVHRTDAGEYVCIVKNEAGEIKSAFKVYVTEIPMSLSLRTKASTWLDWSQWSQWHPKCGKMERMRVRLCKDSMKRCWGNTEESEHKHELCTVNGSWGEWNPWSDCSKTCGSGERRRTRRCDQPVPEHGGKPCPGPSTEISKCKTNPCPVDGSWSTWSSWYPCPEECSPSQTKRIRDCTNPIPAFGGKTCSGIKVEYKLCSEMNCPVDGGWSSWGPWSSCSATCGPSTQSRERLCNNPVPSFGGASCWGSHTEIKICETETCDNVPLFASLNVSVFLNNKAKHEIITNVNISDSTDIRIIKGKTQKDIFRISRARGWFPYLSFVVSPLTWLTAFQKDTAINGFSLTKGVFDIQTFIKFNTGGELIINHKGNGVQDKTLSVEVSLEGDAPIFYSKLLSKSDPYEETYVLTGPGELQASSKNVLRVLGSRSVLYSSRTTITFHSGIRPGLVQILSRKNIRTSRLVHEEEGFISTSVGKKCPPGYKESGGGYCQDINECGDKKISVCHFTQTCVNMNGSYECRCPSGFEPSAAGDCTDVNECLDPAICSHHCENVIGSFKCFCPPGFAILESKTVCSKLPGYHFCPPNYIEKDGICKEEDLCKDGTFCEEDETCMSTNNTCLPTICPDGYRKVKKRCVKDCSLHICESGATHSETKEQMHVKVEGPIVFSRKLYILTTDRSNNTYYRIKENEAGKPFKVKLEDRFVTLYAVANLPPRGSIPYRVTVVATTYNETDSTILYTDEYIVNVYVLD